MPASSACRSRRPSRQSPTHQEDFVLPYVNDLRNIVDTDVVRSAGLRLGVDPLGGAARPYWEPINSVYGLDIVVVNPTIDPRFAFMTVDHDGKIRMVAGQVRLVDGGRREFLQPGLLGRLAGASMRV
jgi:phosphoglucomutase